MTPIRTLCLAAVASLATPAHAGMYFMESGMMMQSNCAGCPKGEKKTQLNPAVIEFLLAERESTVRTHYAALHAWDEAGRGKIGALADSWVLPQAQTLFEQHGDLITELTGAETLDGAIRADPEGVAFARATARWTATAANQMLYKKGWIQWLGPGKWENVSQNPDKPELKIPAFMGQTITLIAPIKSDNQVSLHIWGAGFMPLVKYPIATYDLSGIEGAWDTDSPLSYDEVAQTIERTEGTVVVELDERHGFLIQARKK